MHFSAATVAQFCSDNEDHTISGTMTTLQEIDQEVCLIVLNQLIGVEYPLTLERVPAIYGDHQVSVCAQLAMAKHFITLESKSTLESEEKQPSTIDQLHETIGHKMQVAHNRDVRSGSNAALIKDFGRISWNALRQRPTMGRTVMYSRQEYVEAGATHVQEFARTNNVTLLHAINVINRKVEVPFQGNLLKVRPAVWAAIEKVVFATSTVIGPTTAGQTTDPWISLVLQLIELKEAKITALQDARLADVKEMSDKRMDDSKDTLDRMERVADKRADDSKDTLDRMERVIDKRAGDSKETLDRMERVNESYADRVERLHTNQPANLERIDDKAFQQGLEQGIQQGIQQGISLATEQNANFEQKIGRLEQKSREDTIRIQSLEEQIQQEGPVRLVTAMRSSLNPTQIIVDEVKAAREYLQECRAKLQRQSDSLGADSCLYMSLENDIARIDEVLEITELDDEEKIRALQEKVRELQEKYDELRLQADALSLDPSDNEEDRSEGESDYADETETKTSE